MGMEDALWLSSGAAGIVEGAEIFAMRVFGIELRRMRASPLAVFDNICAAVHAT